jgi:hypothetical protein
MARKKAQAQVKEPLPEQIASLAHALWLERGCPEGSSEADWFKAEQVIREQRKGEIVTLLQQVRIATRA